MPELPEVPQTFDINFNDMQTGRSNPKQLCLKCFLRKDSSQFGDTDEICVDCREED